MAIGLDKVDKRILFELDKNARIPDTQLAKLIGKSKESIRYRINKFIENKVIVGFSTWIDPTRLGYQTYKMYLKIANLPNEREKFYDYIKQHKNVFWFGAADGAWDIGLTFFAKSNEKFYEIKNEILSKFKNLIIKKYTGTVVSVQIFSKNFLYNAEIETKTIFNKPTNILIDDLDKHILEILLKDARITVIDLAKNTKSTVDIVRNRVKKLEENKIIVQYKAIIDWNKLSYELFKTFLYISNISYEDEKKLISYIKQHPKIIHLVKQISPWDIELEILAEDYLDYNKILNELTKEFSNIIETESAIMNQDYVFPSKKLVFEQY